MDWTNLVILSSGLAVGAWVGRFTGRSQPAATEHSANLTGLDPQSSVLNTPVLETPEPQTSDLHTLNHQLQRTQLAYQMAREMAQFQAGFLARTSHELRSPINSVISLHQLILADLAEDPAEEREFIAQANHSAQKMLALLDQLIGVSKAAHGTESLKFQALSLWEALAEVEQFTQMQAKNRNLRLHIELPEPDIMVWADRNALRHVLLSLVDTPIALMQEGQIRLTTEAIPELQQVHICIEDERPASFWHDPIDLLAAIKADKLSAMDDSKSILDVGSQPLSPGFNLLIAQTLLQLMDGHLEVLSVPANSQTIEDSITRIQCSLPLAQ